jgi:hypothetical protein
MAPLARAVIRWRAPPPIDSHPRRGPTIARIHDRLVRTSIMAASALSTLPRLGLAASLARSYGPAVTCDRAGMVRPGLRMTAERQRIN